MDSSPVVPPFTPSARLPWYNFRRWGWNFLTFSILGHFLFVLLAGSLIVATIQGKRKQDFLPPGPKGPNASTRAMEHKVSLAKKQNTMSAPVNAKRITTTSLSKVALPPLPAMKTDVPAMPALAMSGMAGSAAGFGGFGQGGGSGGGGGGGGGLNFFGLREKTASTLVGTFYDLKQNASRQPTNMTPEQYGGIVQQFARGNFNTALLARFYRAPKPVYATRIFTPYIPAELGPAAFDLQNEVQPRMWCVHYKGAVIAPETGTFRFAGMGDDLLLVKFDNRLVLDADWYEDLHLAGQTYYKSPYTLGPRGFAKGLPVRVEAGKTYPIEILIGEQPGGRSCAALMVEKEGAAYAKDSNGNNVLPIFRMTNDNALPDPPSGSQGYTEHADDGPVWRPGSIAPKENSGFNR